MKSKFSIVVAGGRDIYDLDTVRTAIMLGLKDYIERNIYPPEVNYSDQLILKRGMTSSLWSFVKIEIVSGMAPGVDSLACEVAAQRENWLLKAFPADWNKYGKGAGPIRNRQMAEYGDYLIAVWDGESRGTKDMVEQMRRLNKPIYIYRVDQL